MASNAGTGEPIAFQCARCRRMFHTRKVSRLPNVRLTGRKRQRHGDKYSRRVGIRHGGIAREYECLRCGHVGWSRHIDLERTERRQHGKIVA